PAAASGPRPALIPIGAAVAASLHAHLAHALDETLPHLLVLGALHRREIARHFFILVLLEPQHIAATRAKSCKQFVHAVRFGGNAGTHLIIERAPPLHLLRHDGPAARSEEHTSEL